MYLEKTLRDYIEELSARQPTPGGGSVAALTGALASGLISMVGNFTLGNEKYQEVEDEIKTLLDETARLTQEFLKLVEADSESYQKVSQAYKLPKQSPSEKEKRRTAIQEALKEATEVPMKVAQGCSELVELTEEVAKKGNVGLVSDAGVALFLLEAGLKSALVNIEINLRALKDEIFKNKIKQSVTECLEKLKKRRSEIIEEVCQKLGVDKGRLGEM
jgi:formiminotetrahydrofolate cyclodeaminase